MIFGVQKRSVNRFDAVLPDVPAMATMVVPFPTATFVAAVLSDVTAGPGTEFFLAIVTAVPLDVDLLLGITRLTAGAGPETAENVAICMTQGPETVNVAFALLLPAVVTILSSARSLSGEVMIRAVNPLPAVLFPVAIVFAPKTNSFAFVVVAAPLFAAALLPLAPAVTSRVVTPRYSRTRTSGNAAAWLNVTVTVLSPPTTRGA
jgi:hypothetical protein